MKRNLIKQKQKSFFYSFPKEHILDYGQREFDDKTLKDLKNFFQGHYDTNPPKKTDFPTNHLNDRGHATSHNHILFTNCDDANPPSTTNLATSRRSTERLCNHSCNLSCHDASQPCIHNQCSFCKDCMVEWANCSLHNPATGSQTAKDFDTFPKSAITTKPHDPQPPTRCPALPPRPEHKSHS